MGLYETSRKFSGLCGTAMLDAAMAVLYPLDCGVCGAGAPSRRDGAACDDCWRQAEAVGARYDRCAKCGLWMEKRGAGGNVPINAMDRECGLCREMAFTRARSCGRYEGALREVVLRLKVEPHLPVRLRAVAARCFRRMYEEQIVDSVIPVPLHAERIQARGFNQADIIARALAADTGVYADLFSLERAHETGRHRAGMDREARAKSMRAAFVVRAPRLVEGRAILLVDDTMTTGATAHEIAETLLAAGARDVSVLTLTRAVSPWH
ncbi:MAG: ComF family protein [Blastocatellia bacterium]